MADRYTKLFSLPENLYENNCPVMICAGALSKDNQTGKVFVQLRFQNVDSRHRKIVAIKVAIQAFDVAENTLGNVKEYQYLDMKVERSAEDGSRQPIYLDDITARSFSVSVLEVVFENGEIWNGASQNWYSLQQTKLSDKFGTDLMEQYQRDTFTEAEYEPFTKDGIWMCACGALNTIGDSKCCRCHNEKIKQFTALDHNALANNLQTYTAEKQATQEKEAVEKRKTIKKTAIIGGIVAVVICILALIPSIAQNMKYRPIVDQLIGTSWGTWGPLECSFIDKDSVKISYMYDDFDGSWEVIDIADRGYEYYLNGWDYESERIYGQTMRIRITFDDRNDTGKVRTREIYMDVWLKNDGEEIDFLICSPEWMGDDVDPPRKMG